MWGASMYGCIPSPPLGTFLTYLCMLNFPCSSKDRAARIDRSYIDALVAQGECLPYQGKGQSAGQLRLCLFGKIYPVPAKWFSYLVVPQVRSTRTLSVFHPRPQALLATGRSEVLFVF